MRDFIFMAQLTRSTTATWSRMVEIFPIWISAPTSSSLVSEAQYQVKKKTNIESFSFSPSLRSIRAEIITFKLPIFLFMINMNSRCFGMGLEISVALLSHLSLSLERIPRRLQSWEDGIWTFTTSRISLSWKISIVKILASLSRSLKANIISLFRIFILEEKTRSAKKKTSKTFSSEINRDNKEIFHSSSTAARSCSAVFFDDERKSVWDASRAHAEHLSSHFCTNTPGRLASKRRRE